MYVEAREWVSKRTREGERERRRTVVRWFLCFICLFDSNSLLKVVFVCLQTGTGVIYTYTHSTPSLSHSHQSAHNMLAFQCYCRTPNETRLKEETYNSNRRDNLIRILYEILVLFVSSFGRVEFVCVLTSSSMSVCVCNVYDTKLQISHRVKYHIGLMMPV